MKHKAIPLILVSVMTIVTAQLLLKYGVNNQEGGSNLMAFFIGNFLNPYILAGIVMFVISAMLWLLVLSKAELSFSYPALSLGYALTAVAAWFLFNENLNIIRMAGILIVCAGVFSLSRS